MGEAELQRDKKQLIIHANIILYGAAADEQLALAAAAEIAFHWNGPKAEITFGDEAYVLVFDINGMYAAGLTELDVLTNTDPRNNYFRIEHYAHGNISYVDAINCNTGYFLRSNLLDNSTTVAHEFGHTIGLEHPPDIDLRGKGRPGIMYPRGTIVDPFFQYDAGALPGRKGGTVNPVHRVVQPGDIALLNLDNLKFNADGFAVVGEFSSIWHEAEVDGA